MDTRRDFIEKSAAGIVGAGLLSLASCREPDKNCLDNRYIHHVFFWLKDPGNTKVREKFEMELKKLVTIETIIESHLGIPAMTEREIVDKSYSYSLFIAFRNKEGHDIYQVHPKHLDFVKECEDLWEKVIIFDSVNI